MAKKNDKDETQLAALTKILLAMPTKVREAIGNVKKPKKKPAKKRAKS
jgi:hypothetical protein